MNFRIGQRVACIKEGDWMDALDVPNRPKGGSIYTIREKASDGIGLLFHEIRNPRTLHQEGLTEPAWHPHRFRPLVDRKTSIEVFQKMLNPSPQKVRDHIMFDTLADVVRAGIRDSTT